MQSLNEAIDRINGALARLEIEMEASECHGTIAGMLCAHAELGERECVAQLKGGGDPDDLMAEEARELLEGVCAETRRQLGDEEMGFQPLLPEDTTPIEERIGALGEWCQGFLMGLTMSGVTAPDKLPGDAGEAMRDLIEIASIGRYQLEGGETDEESYTELVEYVRTAVLLTCAELGTERPSPSSVH